MPAYGGQRSILTTADERLLAAARSDNEDMLLEVFDEGKFDINAQDGCVTSFRFHVFQLIGLYRDRLGNTGAPLYSATVACSR